MKTKEKADSPPRRIPLPTRLPAITLRPCAPHARSPQPDQLREMPRLRTINTQNHISQSVSQSASLSTPHSPPQKIGKATHLNPPFSKSYSFLSSPHASTAAVTFAYPLARFSPFGPPECVNLQASLHSCAEEAIEEFHARGGALCWRR